MACYNCLDLKSDSPVSKFLANKLVCYLVGIIQLIIYSTALFSSNWKNENQDTGALAFAIIITLVCIAFSVLLLVGLFKDRRLYIKSYLIFIVVLSVVTVISMIITLCTQPKVLGFSGVLSCILIILLNVLTYFVIRNYYLALLSKNQNPNTV